MWLRTKFKIIKCLHNLNWTIVAYITLYKENRRKNEEMYATLQKLVQTWFSKFPGFSRSSFGSLVVLLKKIKNNLAKLGDGRG
jgi:hypothetical protein